MAIDIDTNRPSTRILLISIVIMIIAIFGHVEHIRYLSDYHFWIAVLGYVALLAGTLDKRL